MQQPDSRVLSYAPQPREPSSPHLSRAVAFAALVGFVLSAGALLLRESLFTHFRTAEQLEAATGLPTISQIPLIPVRQRGGVVEYLLKNPTSVAAESIRNLRTSIVMAQMDRPPQVILSTSALPGEGKSTMSIALAMNYVGLGKKVLLIEGDSRRRVFDSYGVRDRNNGMAGVFAGDAEIGQVIQRVERLNVDVLTSGEMPINAADAYSSDRFAELMAELRQMYDVILIDTPPVLLVPDARIISVQSDAAILNVKWQSTSRQQVEEALRQFQQVGQGFVGCVLSQVDTRKMKKYGYGRGYGAYSHYGAGYYHTS